MVGTEHWALKPPASCSYTAMGLADAMPTAVNCADNAALRRAEADAAVYDDPGGLGLLVAQIGRCPPDWPAAPGAFNVPVESDIPAPLLAGSSGPTTPPDDTRAVADRMTNSTFVLIEPGTHFVSAFDGRTIASSPSFSRAPRQRVKSPAQRRSQPSRSPDPVRQSDLSDRTIAKQPAVGPPLRLLARARSAPVRAPTRRFRSPSR
jgi:hypothetical protein